MRLDALLSRYGYCSRREAPGWIKRHSITFKGEPCSAPTDKVQAEGILLDGEPVEKYISMPSTMITRDNLHEFEIDGWQ